MMNVKISPHELSGLVSAPISKSEAHRMLICSALSDKPSKLFYGQQRLSDDIMATINCLRSLGAKISFSEDNFLDIVPIDANNMPDEIELDCNESGSTLRFLLPVAAALSENVSFKGCGRLPERPVVDLMNALKKHGVNFSSERLPFKTSGKLQAGIYELPGDVSSQYISGLMFALPLLKNDSVIKLTSNLKSAAYIDITISALKKFGIQVTPSPTSRLSPPCQGAQEKLEVGLEYKITGGKKFVSPGAVSVEGDWSGAAFFLAAGALSGPVSVTGLSINSKQGDKKVLDILEEMGAKVKIENNVVTVSPASQNNHRHVEIDIDPTPDLLPVLAIAASCSGCEMKFYNASRLRLKESDRIAATASIIRSLGGDVTEKADELLVKGNRKLKIGAPSRVNGFHDHRIVMAAAIAGVKSSNEIIITDAESIGKSYPEFFKDYASLGGRVNVL